MAYLLDLPAYAATLSAATGARQTRHRSQVLRYLQERRDIPEQPPNYAFALFEKRGGAT